MVQNDCNPKLSDIINKAYSTEYPGNKFPFDKRAEEKAQLLKGIQERAEKQTKGTEGQIDLDLTLNQLLEDRNAFKQDIDDFIAAKTRGKYQYALRFETLLNYINHQYSANISTNFLKKYLHKDADRRRIELLKMMHSTLSHSGKGMAKIAEELGVDIKTIREDFKRLETDFSFLDVKINIDGFDKHNRIHNSPVHPVFLALNTTQLYSLFFALKVMGNDTVLETTALEIAHSTYSQLTELGQELIADIYQANDFPEGFNPKFINSATLFQEEEKQWIVHAAAYKIPCSVTYLNNNEKVTVSGIPKINIENGYTTFILSGPDGDHIINGSDVIKAS